MESKIPSRDDFFKDILEGQNGNLSSFSRAIERESIDQFYEWKLESNSAYFFLLDLFREEQAIL